MESIHFHLTQLQREKLVCLQEIVFSAQNALSLMSFHNECNRTPDKVDETITLTIQLIESHLDSLKRIHPTEFPG